MLAVLAVVRLVANNRALARVVCSFALFITTEYAVWIAMLVYAFDRGGATEAGVVALAQLVPAALAAPVLAVRADRTSPARLLVIGYLAQAATMAATALAIAADAPVLLVYGGAVLAATAVVSTRPAQSPLLPSLARSVEELTSANVLLGWAENASIVLAGLMAGLLLSFADAALVFAVSAGFVLVGAVAVLPLRAHTALGASHSDRSSALHELAVGVRLVARQRQPRLLVSLLAAEWVVIGGLDVLFVVLALDVLDTGQAWAGYLNTAYGFGGVLAGALCAVLVGRRLGLPIVGAGLILSTGLVLTAVIPGVVTAVVLLAIVGAGRAVFDVAVRTLLQRAVPAEVVGRVFGLVEGLAMAGLAVGSLYVPALIGLGGSTAALIGVAAVLPLAALVGGRALLAVDAAATVPVVEIALLRSLRMFADLPPPALEGLARSVEHLELPAEAVLMREGEPGDRYYVISSGELAVTRGGRDLGTRRRGDGVGEIALIHGVPRTATVVAATPVRLCVLGQEAFLTALSGHGRTGSTANLIAAERLDDADPAVSDEAHHAGPQPQS